jgi:hypothetical protein
MTSLSRRTRSWLLLGTSLIAVGSSCGSSPDSDAQPADSTRTEQSSAPAEAATPSPLTEAPESSVGAADAADTSTAAAESFDAAAFFQKIAPTVDDLGPDYVFLFDPMGPEQDSFDKSLQDALAECNGSTLLMPYLVPVTKAEAAKGWFHLDTVSDQQPGAITEVLVMHDEAEAKALMDQVRSEPNLVECRTAWVAAITTVNATTDGPLKGRDVNFASTDAALSDPLDSLGDDQLGMRWQQNLTVDGEVAPPVQSSTRIVRIGQVILLHDDTPAGDTDRMTELLVARIRAALG